MQYLLEKNKMQANSLVQLEKAAQTLCEQNAEVDSVLLLVLQKPGLLEHDEKLSDSELTLRWLTATGHVQDANFEQIARAIRGAYATISMLENGARELLTSLECRIYLAESAARIAEREAQQTGAQ